MKILFNIMVATLLSLAAAGGCGPSSEGLSIPAPPSVPTDPQDPQDPEDPPGPTDPEDPPVTPPVTGGTDLSAAETANCYIVTAPGTYKFKTVKGNSTSSVGSVASAAVLWEIGADGAPAESGSVIAAVGCSSGYISFATPSTLKNGNALIAAKNSSGKVLWSWHIWIPQTAPTSGLYNLSWYNMLSRNLGAMTDASASSGPEAYGLLYQWGRKDPFPCAAPSEKASAMTLDASIEKPTTFACGEHTWMSSVNGTVWGDKATKTQYDPCPPGYKVPMREDVTAVFQTDALSETEGWQYSSGHAFAIGSPQVWFPYPGYIDATGSYVGSGSYTKVWNSHMDSANNHGYGIFVNGSSSTRSSQNAAQGGSVRCVSLKQAEFTNDPGMPVQGSYDKKVFDNNVVELSGLCLSKDKDFLWGVGDEGYLYKFTNIDGSVSNITASQPLGHDAFYGGQYTSSSGELKDYWYDMEGITIDPSTGDLYFAYEPKRVFRVKSPYTTVEKKLFDVEEAADMGNSGMEGIAWYKGDLLVGSQSGATLWRYTVSGTKLWKKQLGTIAPGIQEVGDLFYDSETDLLWVSDSEACKLFVFNGDVTRLKAIYDVSFIGNAESVCVDHARKCVWVGDDGSTSKIFKISFTGL